MWTLDQSDTDPLYKRIIRLIEAHIASGTLAPGERLPAERVLARSLSVNRTTVIQALGELAARGVLVQQRGSGTYVNSRKWGVQSYPMVNWQGPFTALPKKEAAFLREAARAREEATHAGTDFYDLSGDELAPDLLPRVSLPEGAFEEAVHAEQGSSAALLGLGSLRLAVQRFLRDNAGLSVPLEEILITSGSRQALFLISQCMLKPGDAVGVEAPSYFYSLPLFQAAGLRLFALPMDEHGVTLDGLEEVARRRSLKMIFLNPIFHNPTGTVLQNARKKAVLDFCAGMRLPIVEDDAYSLLFFSNARDCTPMKAWDRQNQTIYVGSLSSYAGRGIRAGWMLAPQSVLRKLAEVRLMMDAGPSVLPQVLAREYLDQVAPAHLPALRTTLALRARNMAAHLRGIFGTRLEFGLASGGLYCYASTPDGSYEALQAEFLRNNIVPALGEAFGDTGGAFRLNHSFFRQRASD